MRSHSRFTVFPLLALAFVGLANGTKTWGVEHRSLKAARESVTRSELKTHVNVLADDTFEGREAGTRGGHAAGNYLVKLLAQLELKPGGERGSYYQAFDANSRNILAILEGSDPQKKQEYILIGGHYDHVGYGTRRNSYGPWGYIHNGADDNASGVAGLLEVAQAMQMLPEAPKRSVVFAFWDGEEKGLLGSKHWVRTPTLPLARVKCSVNVDMIGRLTKQRLEVYGTRTAPGLRQIVSHANQGALDLDFTWTMKDDSDHWPFFAQSIPALMLHTGLHNDYHRPSDDVERINSEGLEEVSRLLLETVVALANADDPTVFRAESRRENNEVRRALEQPAPAPAARLGMTWRKESRADNAKLQLRIVTVNRGSAAEQAAIRPGDLVIADRGQHIEDDLAFRQHVLATSQPLELTIQRGAEPPREVTVKLHGTPIRVGLTTRSDAAEPGVVQVTHVVFGSPAAVAGLRVADRIEAVDGKPFANAAEFSQLLDQAGDTLVLRTERGGQVRETTLTLAK